MVAVGLIFISFLNMGKRITIRIAQHLFGCKKDAVEYIRGVQSKYKDGERISEIDESFIRELLKLHPHASEKIGSGVRYVTLESNQLWKGKTRCFTVHRIDGTQTDFSYLKCLKEEDYGRDVLGAMRDAVRDQILEFRNMQFRAGPVKCPFTGLPLSPNTAHVDHAAPNTFEVLAQQWLTQEALVLGAVSITASTDNQVIREMTDNRQRAAWQDFHRRNAQLRLTSPRGNLSHAKKQKATGNS